MAIRRLLAVTAILFLLANMAICGEIEISGLTHQWKGGENYAPLAPVKVVVSRNGSFVGTTDSDINAQGDAEYKIRVRSGEPISIVFHLSADYVPEVQSLSARDKEHHRVSTALLTLGQYRELHRANPSIPSLEEKLRCISKHVPRESPIWKEFQDLMRKAGVE